MLSGMGETSFPPITSCYGVRGSPGGSHDNKGDEGSRMLPEAVHRATCHRHLESQDDGRISLSAYTRRLIRTCGASLSCRLAHE